MVLDYTMPRYEGRLPGHPFLDRIKRHRYRSAFTKFKYYPALKRRWKRFKEFSRRHMKVSEEKYTQKTLEKAKLDYDVIIAESDVIWAPCFADKTFDRSFFLALDSMGGLRKIAYAPSLSCASLDPGLEDEFRELLKGLDAISSRDKTGCELVQLYTDKPVQQVIDPVLLLPQEAYDDIVSPRLTSKPYVFVYNLGKSRQLMEEAREYANKRSLELFEITLDVFRHDTADVLIKDASVEDFLSGIKYADIVFTDSFHALCFSLLFHKPFYAFSRKLFNGKVEDILRMTGLYDRYVSPDARQEACGSIEWDRIDSLLAEKRKESGTWLINALKGTEVYDA